MLKRTTWTERVLRSGSRGEINESMPGGSQVMCRVQQREPSDAQGVAKGARLTRSVQPREQFARAASVPTHAKSSSQKLVLPLVMPVVNAALTRGWPICLQTTFASCVPKSSSQTPFHTDEW